MPTYVYKCIENDHIFEVKQSFTDPPVTECEECGSDVRRVINNVGIVFKGKGFYVTDNRGKNPAAPGKSAANEGGGESTSADSSEKSSDSKSEKKPEKKAEKSAEKTKS